jgi:hypothetical protein
MAHSRSGYHAFGARKVHRHQTDPARPRNHAALAALCVGLLLLTVSGCGQRLYRVRGQVVYKDGSDVSVLAGGKVLFEPADSEMEQASARGDIQSNGSFEMSTSSPGDGVKPGNYLIMVSPPPFFAKRRGETRPRLLDDRFRSFDTSGLKITVSGPVDDFTVTVHKP